MKSKRLIAGTVAAALLLAVAGGGVLLRNEGTSASDPVLVTDGSGVVEEFTSLKEAEAFVAEKVGFTVVGPESLPDGFRVTELTFNPPPPRPGPVLQRVSYKVKRGSSGFTFLAVNRAFDFAGKDSEHAITTSGGATLYKTNANGTSEYTLVTDSKGWVAMVPDELGIDQEEIERMFESLPRD